MDRFILDIVRSEIGLKVPEEESEFFEAFPQFSTKYLELRESFRSLAQRLQNLYNKITSECIGKVKQLVSLSNFWYSKIFLQSEAESQKLFSSLAKPHLTGR